MKWPEGEERLYIIIKRYTYLAYYLHSKNEKKERGFNFGVGRVLMIETMMEALNYYWLENKDDDDVDILSFLEAK